MALGLAALLFPLAGSALRAADGDEIVGVWHTEADGLREVWHIKTEDGKWAVSGDYYDKKNKHVGHYDGKDVQYADGKLTFVQHWTKKPNPVWGDEAKMTAAVGGEKLAYTWDLGTSSGSREMSKGAK
jgi:hypothetical protein